jgi:hypothetical protein
LSNYGNTTLTTVYAGSTIGNPFNGQVLSSAVLNITLSDGQGRSITELDLPLTVCLALSNNTKKDERVCLSYYDEKKGKWRCEDECLTNINNRKNGTGNLLCGETGHLTNFALLLSGQRGGQEEDPCQSISRDLTLSWVSLGFVLGAFVLIVLCGLVIEVNVRWRVHVRNRPAIRKDIPF